METKHVRTLNVLNPTPRPVTITEKPVAVEPRKLSNRQRLDKALSTSQVDRFIAQEQKRATRWQIDQNGTLWLLTALSAVSFIASAILVANGTISVAQFMILSEDWFGYMVFGAIEVAILALMLLYLIVGSRPDENDPSKPAKAGRWFIAMCVFVGITIMSQVFHTIDGWNYNWTEPRMWVGVVLSIVVPMSYVLISKGLSSVVFARAIFLPAKVK